MQRQLIALLIVAAVAGWSLASWASFGDAPWEDDGGPSIEEQREAELDILRCEGAISYRNAAITVGGRGSEGWRRGDIADFLEEAIAEVRNLCR